MGTCQKCCNSEICCKNITSFQKKAISIFNFLFFKACDSVLLWIYVVESVVLIVNGYMDPPGRHHIANHHRKLWKDYGITTREDIHNSWLLDCISFPSLKNMFSKTSSDENFVNKVTDSRTSDI